MICLTILQPISRDEASRTVFGDGAVGEVAPPAPSALVPALAGYSMVFRAPTARCAWAARVLGIGAKAEPALCDLDYGAWRGRTTAEVAATEPCGLSEFLTDPDATPHGGESVRQLCRRVSDWLNDLPPFTAEVVVIAEPVVARAALVHALSEPVRAFWHITAPSLATMVLPSRNSLRRTPQCDAAPRHRRTRGVPRQLTPAPPILTGAAVRFPSQGVAHE
ncbi:histidine phosphatase family protein [Streptomyces sp. NPDC058985]|uniref:histidine phosphatase family protein n=1 Tax=Streptomyces sp. NPDC058985 TaxID=3346684 RepID=UPI00368F758F